MTDITVWLERAGRGDTEALKAVFDRLYPELRGIAARRVARLPPGATVTPTALVHDVYLRLVGNRKLALNDRRHFFACAARAMRELLIDQARRASAQKRGGELREVTFSEELGMR
jgi:RNA polymerase sigma factor (TIGR02999 family)